MGTTFDFLGKTILITGASQGIGREIAAAFAQNGAKIIVLARNQSALEHLIDAHGGTGAGHRAVACDLLNDDVPAIAQDVLDQAGTIHAIVHCAGASRNVRDIFGPLKDWSEIWRLNVGQAIEINNVIVPDMVKQGFGRVVHFSTNSSFTGGGAAPYAAAKAYLNMYVKTLARTVAPSNVLVNAVAPSAIAAEGNNWRKAEQNNPEVVAKYLAEHQAIGRLGVPADLVPFVLLLSSESNSFAAGSVLMLDGAAY